MKTILKAFALILLLVSCKSNDLIQEHMINEYSKIKTKDNVVVVIKSKYPSLKALKVFNGLKYKTPEGNYVGSGSKYHDTIISKQLYNNFKSINTHGVWSDKNFEKASDTLILIGDNFNDYYKKRIRNSGKEIIVYTFSDVINYTDEIKFYRTTKSQPDYLFYDKVIIYKKIKNKWEKVEVVNNTDLH